MRVVRGAGQTIHSASSAVILRSRVGQAAAGPCAVGAAVGAATGASAAGSAAGEVPAAGWGMRFVGILQLVALSEGALNGEWGAFMPSERKRGAAAAGTARVSWLLALGKEQARVWRRGESAVTREEGRGMRAR